MNSKLLFISMVSMFASTMAFANVDVSCFGSDCFTNGWSIYDTQSGRELVVGCKVGDCLNRGWVTKSQGRPVEEVICLRGGCFNEGWQVFDVRTGRLTAETICLNSFSVSDCLTIGWTTREVGGGTYTFRCTNGDCLNEGWDVGYPPQPLARCKPEGCFNQGWIIYR